jgi:hypothetical protein
VRRGEGRGTFRRVAEDEARARPRAGGRGEGASAAETARGGKLRRQRGEAGRRHGSGGAVAGVAWDRRGVLV